MKTNHKLKIDYKGCHEGLWNWLADNPKKSKNDWPGLKTIKSLLEKEVLHPLNNPIHFEGHHCFACQMVGINEHGNLICRDCPVDFGDTFCQTGKSYFDEWCANINCSANARKIAQGWTK